TDVLLMADVRNLPDDEQCARISAEQKVCEFQSSLGRSRGHSRLFAACVARRTGLSEQLAERKLSLVPGRVVVDEALVDRVHSYLQIVAAPYPTEIVLQLNVVGVGVENVICPDPEIEAGDRPLHRSRVTRSIGQTDLCRGIGQIQRPGILPVRTR